MEEHPTNVANTGKAAWLGMSKESSIWYRLGNEGLRKPINFSNWDNKVQQSTATDCAFTKKDGKWSWYTRESCQNLELCTICRIIAHPVLTMNGLCNDTTFDYNYYVMTGENSTVDYYEGYKSANIIFKNNKWTFVAKKGNVTQSSIENDVGRALTFPIGRLQWEIYEPKCGIWQAQRILLSLSRCRFGQQFTCNSGTCIAVSYTHLTLPTNREV